MAPRPCIAVVVMLLSAAMAEGSQVRILFAPGRALNAGEVVTVGWEGLPPDVEELEFLLATGAEDVVRLTPQFMPAKGSFAWTVPNLPSRDAVLELRAGIDGEELVLASSEPFVINGAPGRGHLEFRDHEWWSVETGTPSPDPPVVRAVMHVYAKSNCLRSRQPLLCAGNTDLLDARRADASDVTSTRVDTHRGAPLVVPQRK